MIEIGFFKFPFQIIEDYMKEKDQRTLLSDCKGQITMEVRSRHKIIQIAVDFMMDQFGEDVNMFERQMTARALVKLFPFLGALEGQNIGIVRPSFSKFNKKLSNNYNRFCFVFCFRERSLMDPILVG